MQIVLKNALLKLSGRVAKVKLFTLWESNEMSTTRPEEREAWFTKHNVPYHTFRKWLKKRVTLVAKSKRFSTKWKRQDHTQQRKGIFYKKQEELVRRITAKRARGLPVSGTWCRIIMRNLVADLGDVAGAKDFKASSKCYNAFRKRWGFSFQEKTNVKKKSVIERLHYERKHHQYLLYTAFDEEP